MQRRCCDSSNEKKKEKERNCEKGNLNSRILTVICMQINAYNDFIFSFIISMNIIINRNYKSEITSIWAQYNGRGRER